MPSSINPSPSTPATITITPALPADLPTMVSICCAAMEPDILTHFLYSPLHAAAVRKQTDSLMTSLGKRFTQPTNRCYIHKAADERTGELVGWSLVRWEDGTWGGASAAGSGSAGGAEKGEDFMARYQRDVRERWVRITGGREFVGEFSFSTNQRLNTWYV